MSLPISWSICSVVNPEVSCDRDSDGMCGMPCRPFAVGRDWPRRAFVGSEGASAAEAAVLEGADAAEPRLVLLALPAAPDVPSFSSVAPLECGFEPLDTPAPLLHFVSAALDFTAGVAGAVPFEPFVSLTASGVAFPFS